MRPRTPRPRPLGASIDNFWPHRAPPKRFGTPREAPGPALALHWQTPGPALARQRRVRALPMQDGGTPLAPTPPGVVGKQVMVGPQTVS